MGNIRVHIENCYGIGKLDHTFDFSQKPTVIVYAPNGMMKTSFTKTLKAYAEDRAAEDMIYTARTSTMTFDDGGTPLKKDSIYIVDADNYVPAVKSVTTFLASEELKREYDAIFAELDQALKEFYGKLKTVSQSSDCPGEIRSTFTEGGQEKTDFEIFEKILPEVRSQTHLAYVFKYNDVFDKGGKVRVFLEKNRAKLQEYFDAYQRVLTTSEFFKDINGCVFGTEQAGTVLKGLEDGTFFGVGHRLQLNGSTMIDSYDSLKAQYDDELARIVNDASVKKAFDKIDKAIGANQSLRDFKAVLVAHNEYLTELMDYDAFQKKVWRSYLSQVLIDLESLNSLYQSKKAALAEIYRRADAEQETWRRVITVFKDRFYAPFEVDVVNQRSVLFRHDDAVLKFSYKEIGNADANCKVPEPEDVLKDVLSRGEYRAFCILQILFEIEARKKKPLLIVFDDIADSFDYRNKYAIIEYIRDLQQEPNVRTIILTHNLDFYRTVASRLGLDRNVNCLFAQKDIRSREVSLNNGVFLKNLILAWINSPSKRIVLAMLPFVRNLVEYMQVSNSPDYLRLTTCLHNIKHTDPRLPVTRSVSVQDVLSVYYTVIPRLTISPTVFVNGGNAWVEELKQEAVAIAAEQTPNETALENKVVLAMVIRLQAEAFMDDYLVRILGQQPFISTKPRFGELFDTWRKTQTTVNADVVLLNKVSMMTPEHIHLNSFMYEPLVDMSLVSLLNLHREVMQKWAHVSF